MRRRRWAVDVVVWEVFVVDDHFGVLVEVEIGQVNPVATDVLGAWRQTAEVIAES